MGSQVQNGIGAIYCNFLFFVFSPTFLSVGSLRFDEYLSIFFVNSYAQFSVSFIFIQLILFIISFIQVFNFLCSIFIYYFCSHVFFFALFVVLFCLLLFFLIYLFNFFRWWWCMWRRATSSLAYSSGSAPGWNRSTPRQTASCGTPWDSSDITPRYHTSTAQDRARQGKAASGWCSV